MRWPSGTPLSGQSLPRRFPEYLRLAGPYWSAAAAYRLGKWYRLGMVYDLGSVTVSHSAAAYSSSLVRLSRSPCCLGAVCWLWLRLVLACWYSLAQPSDAAYRSQQRCKSAAAYRLDRAYRSGLSLPLRSAQACSFQMERESRLGALSELVCSLWLHWVLPCLSQTVQPLVQTFLLAAAALWTEMACRLVTAYRSDTA